MPLPLSRGGGDFLHVSILARIIIVNIEDYEPGQTFIFPGPIVESIDDPERWGHLRSISDCGECIYIQFFGKVSGCCGVSKSLYKLA